MTSLWRVGFPPPPGAKTTTFCFVRCEKARKTFRVEVALLCDFVRVKKCGVNLVSVEFAKFSVFVRVSE